jgi:uncharacterized protein (DUF58 family)
MFALTKHWFARKPATQTPPTPAGAVLQQTDESAALYSTLAPLMAWQAQVKPRKFNAHNALQASQGGAHCALRKGRGMTFSEVRPYQFGDDIRHMDWRVTARTQKPHTKVFIEEHERPTWLLCEQSPALFFASQTRLKAVQALNISTILGWVALNQNDRVGSLSFNHLNQAWQAPKSTPASFIRSVQHAIELQAQVQFPAPVADALWQNALQTLHKMVKPGSKIFIIGDLLTLSPTSLSVLNQLRRHNELVAIHIYDPLDKQLPNLGWLSFGAPNADGEPLRLDSFKPDTRTQYANSYQTAWQIMQAQFVKMRVPLIEICNTDAPLQALMSNKILV